MSVVIPGTEAEDVAKRILDNLELEKKEQKPPFPVSVSLGIASYMEVAKELHEEGVEEVTSSHVIRKADERMYEAKREYRKNRKKLKSRG